jgi:hypothetical protein
MRGRWWPAAHDSRDTRVDHADDDLSSAPTLHGGADQRPAGRVAYLEPALRAAHRIFTRK